MVKKGILGTVGGLWAYIIGSIGLAVVVMGLLILIDFLTGVLGNKAMGGKYDPQMAEKGLYKKLAMLIFWLVVVLFEALIAKEGGTIGFVMSVPIPSLVATSYIIGNETLSIGKNLSNMGFDVPSWFNDLGEKAKNINGNDKIN